MTTEQRMFPSRRSAGRPLAAAARTFLAACCLLSTLLATGCAGGEPLTPPRPLISPYRQAEGDLIWAVAPLRNESGTSLVDSLAVSDALVNRLQEVDGVSGLPMNRTIGAMRATGVQQVDSPAAARQLARSLGADAILVGTITAWDPYEPPEFGMNLALFAVSERMHAASEAITVDPRAMQAAASDYGLEPPEPSRAGDPVAAVSEHFNGASHEVQMLARRYAEGRHQRASSLGWKRYLASMPLFTEFACYTLVDELLDVERIRLAQLAAGEQESR